MRSREQKFSEQRNLKTGKSSREKKIRRGNRYQRKRREEERDLAEKKKEQREKREHTKKRKRIQVTMQVSQVSCKISSSGMSFHRRLFFTSSLKLSLPLERKSLPLSRFTCRETALLFTGNKYFSLSRLCCRMNCSAFLFPSHSLDIVLYVLFGSQKRPVAESKKREFGILFLVLRVLYQIPSFIIINFCPGLNAVNFAWKSLVMPHIHLRDCSVQFFRTLDIEALYSLNVPVNVSPLQKLVLVNFDWRRRMNLLDNERKKGRKREGIKV